MSSGYHGMAVYYLGVTTLIVLLIVAILLAIREDEDQSTTPSPTISAMAN
ncbi:MAG: hypothetical protein AAB531_04020 [Patescibacteria group bacterium]